MKNKMIDVAKVYEDWCKQWKIPFKRVDNVHPYDDTTLFCPAGMQQFKSEFKDPNIRDKTVANIQPCIRMNDFSEVGDATHLLYFNMIGLFSFRDLSVALTIQFFMGFMEKLGLKVDYVTIPPNHPEWRTLYKPYDVEVRVDESCVWSDGEISGYCTEFFINDIEIGNIVNPVIQHSDIHKGNCIDVGFGLERLDMLVNHKLAPSKAESLMNTVEVILKSGYEVGPKLQGYVLRKLIRELYKMKVTWDHPAYKAEVYRQVKLRQLYERLKVKNTHKPAEWWYDTHGIILEDMK